MEATVAEDGMLPPAKEGGNGSWNGEGEKQIAIAIAGLADGAGRDVVEIVERRQSVDANAVWPHGDWAKVDRLTAAS